MMNPREKYRHGCNERGVALLFMVLVFTVAAASAVLVMTVGMKIKNIGQEDRTMQRLQTISQALRNYYLVHYDLPDPSATTPPYSVPADLLNLPQKYRFDSNGQIIRYDRGGAGNRMTTVENIIVDGQNVGAVLVAAGPNHQIDSTSSPYSASANDDVVLGVSLQAEAIKVAMHAVSLLQQAALAYDRQFCDYTQADPDPNNQNTSSQCLSINNDADTMFLPPVSALHDDGTWDVNTQWFDYTRPVRERFVFDCSGGANSGVWEPVGAADADGDFCYTNVGTGDHDGDPTTPDVPLGHCTRNLRAVEIWSSNFAGTDYYYYCNQSENTYNSGQLVPDNDEDVLPARANGQPHHGYYNPNPAATAPFLTYDTDGDGTPEENHELYLLSDPVPLIDEDGYAAAQGGDDTISSGCIRLANVADGNLLTNDPDRGTATLDNCSSGQDQVAYHLARAFGLNLVKLGWNGSAVNPQLLDPWGNPYQWGRSDDYRWGSGPALGRPDLENLPPDPAGEDQSRDPHYWSFFSRGPDGNANSSDDLLPAADRIPGYYITPLHPIPIP